MSLKETVLNFIGKNTPAPGERPIQGTRPEDVVERKEITFRCYNCGRVITRMLPVNTKRVDCHFCKKPNNLGR